MIIATILATAFIGASRMSERAVDIVEAAVNAYTPEHIEQFLVETETQGAHGHGFPRLAANLSMLVANGRRQGDRELLKRMMTVACRNSAQGMMQRGCSGGHEFSVRELVLAIVALERAGIYPKAVTDAWRADIAKVDAVRCYTRGAIPAGQPRAQNWCLFGAASEQARIKYGMGGDPKFVEKFVVDQLRWFDERGMFRDPNEPIVYDLVPRLMYAHILDLGYNGPKRDEVLAQLEKSADLTLKFLSAAGEIPYGGRSNQMLHNHTLYAGLCTWYARHYAERGDWRRSAQFADAATRAIDALDDWLKLDPVRHVKNRYPWAKPEFGCEKYAYFDKYMVTMGSWAISVMQFSEDEGAVDVTELSEVFHQVLMRAGEYSAQLDYNSNVHYDGCNGMGRFQRRGAPSVICLSVPCPQGSDIGYRTEKTNEVALAIAPVGAGELKYVGKRTTPSEAITEWRLGTQTWTCALSADGLTLKLAGEGKLALALPALEWDGANAAKVACDGKTLTIEYRGYVCKYTALRGEIADSALTCANRNGRYRRFLATGENAIEVKVTISRNF